MKPVSLFYPAGVFFHDLEGCVNMTVIHTQTPRVVAPPLTLLLHYER